MIASIIVLLHLIGFIDANSAITSLYIAGAMLLIAELGVVSFGLIALNGLIAIYAGYTLQTGSDIFFGLELGWSVLFGIAFVEVVIVGTVITVHMWLRNKKATTGTESMIGATATVLGWSGTKGSVRVEGEIWKALSSNELELKPDEEVTIETINKLNLIIKKENS